MGFYFMNHPIVLFHKIRIFTNVKLCFNSVELCSVGILCCSQLLITLRFYVFYLFCSADFLIIMECNKCEK